MAPIFHNCRSVYTQDKRSLNENSTLNLFTNTYNTPGNLGIQWQEEWPVTHLHGNVFNRFMLCFKMYWIVNFHFLLLKMRKRNKRYFLLTISKKSRFSPSETVIAFVMHSYKQKCQSPRKKVWSMVWKLESYSEEGKKFGFWELKEKGDLIPRGKYFRKLAYFHE